MGHDYDYDYDYVAEKTVSCTNLSLADSARLRLITTRGAFFQTLLALSLEPFKRVNKKHPNPKKTTYFAEAFSVPV